MAEWNPYKGRCWSYIFEAVPINAAGKNSVAAHVSQYIEELMNQAFLKADISVPAAESSGAWSANSSLLNGTKADGGKWEVHDLIRFNVRIETAIPAKARRAVDKAVQAYPSIFTVVHADGSAVATPSAQRPTVKAALKRLAINRGPAKAMKRRVR